MLTKNKGGEKRIRTREKERRKYINDLKKHKDKILMTRLRGSGETKGACDSLEKTLCEERLKAGEEGDDRG